MSFFQLSRDGFVGVEREELRGGDTVPPSRTGSANTFTFSNVDDQESASAEGDHRTSAKASRKGRRKQGDENTGGNQNPSSAQGLDESLRVTIESQELGHTVKQKFNQDFNKTLDAEHEVARQKLETKRAVWQAKQEGYKVHAYGSPQQQREYKAKLRKEILAQVHEKEERKTTEQRERSKEALVAIEQDRSVVRSEHEQHRKRALHMKQYSRFNQELIETRKKEAASARQRQHQQDRALLDKESFNWSKTLT